MEESENNLETMMENLFFTGSPRPKRMVSDVNLLRDSEKEVKIGEEYQAKLPTLLKEEVRSNLKVYNSEMIIPINGNISGKEKIRGQRGEGRSVLVVD